MRHIGQFLPERYKGPVRAALGPRTRADLEPWKSRKKVVVTLAGFYQNLGDMALTFAQKRFIEATLPDYEVLLFASTDTYSSMRALKRVVGPRDIITTIGGGNMDDLYSSLENARRFVVRSFPNNPIVSFPQTMAFSDTESGRRALRRSARTYRTHRNLVVFARERHSFELMQNALAGTRVECSPDTVLSLTLDLAVRERAGILVSIRGDKEAALSSEDRSRIAEILHAKTDDVLFRDTVDVALDDCQPETFEDTLQEYWALLASRRLVVTDRLHTMIFSVITGTPVIVLSNNNHKIKGTYEAWLKHLPGACIRYADSFDELAFAKAVDELGDISSEGASRAHLSDEFESLRSALIAAAGRA